MTKKTTAQQIAELDKKRALILARERKLENGQKILAGTLLIAYSKLDPTISKWFVESAAKFFTRDIDKKRMQPLIESLNSSINKTGKQIDQTAP